jgi:flagellar motor component MotA
VGLIGDGGSEWLAYAMGGAMTGTISGYFLLQLLRRPLTPTTA